MPEFDVVYMASCELPPRFSVPLWGFNGFSWVIWCLLVLVFAIFCAHYTVMTMSVIILMVVWVVAVPTRRSKLRKLYPVLLWDIAFAIGFALMMHPSATGSPIDLIMSIIGNFIDGEEELEIFWKYFLSVPWYRKVLIVLFFAEKQDDEKSS